MMGVRPWRGKYSTAQYPGSTMYLRASMLHSCSTAIKALCEGSCDKKEGEGGLRQRKTAANAGDATERDSEGGAARGTKAAGGAEGAQA